MSDSEIGSVPAAPLSLASREIHIWCISNPRNLPYLQLSAREVERAQAYRLREHRDRFVRRRGALRRILGAYTLGDPEGIEFRMGSDGKPHLRNEDHVTFNLSYSGNVLLIAVGRDVELGVDIERVRPLAEWRSLAERWFSQAENRTIRRLPVCERVRAFYSVWTQKEAIVKALGQGVGGVLRGLSTSVLPWPPRRFRTIKLPEKLRHNCNSRESTACRLLPLQLGDDCVGALSALGEVRSLGYWGWK